MSSQRIVLVAPAAPGSKGDEGMIRGALELFRAYPVLIVNPEDDTSWLDKLALTPAERERVSEAPGPIRTFGERLNGDDIVVFIGADVVDGSCGLPPSLERLDLASDALMHGLRVCIASCTIRSRVAPEILERLRLMGGLTFLVRDEQSLLSLRRQTGVSGRYFPDFSFFCPPKTSELTDSIKAQIDVARQTHDSIIGVNVSEHSFRSFYDEHTDANRLAFVSSILEQIAGANPDAFYVLTSSDERRWPNHPSDDDFAEMADAWIRENVGSGRAIKTSPDISFPENITILDYIDLLVTGRMHLSLAGLRSSMLSIVLMGNQKGYTNIDKMRGTFAKHYGSTDAVVWDLENLGPMTNKYLAQRHDLAAKLVQARRRIETSESKDAETFLGDLKRAPTDDTPSMSQLHAAQVSAMASLIRRSDELAQERAVTEGLRQQLAQERAALSAAHQQRETDVADLRAQLDQQRASSEGLQSELSQVRTSSENLQLQLSQQLTLLEELRSEFAEQKQQGQADLERERRVGAAKYDVLSGELRSAEDEARNLRKSISDLTGLLSEKEQVLQSGDHLSEQQIKLAQSNLEAIQKSTAWRVTKPVRALVERVPPSVRLTLRRGAKAVWWVATPHRTPARLAFLRARRLDQARHLQELASGPTVDQVVAPEPQQESPVLARAEPEVDFYVERCRTAAPEPFPDTAGASVIDVSVIVPVRNNWAATQTCLNSVGIASRDGKLAYEVILVDDASSDDTVHAAEIYPGLKVIRQEKLTGSVRSRNAGAAAARGRYLMFLNVDTLLLPGALAELVKVAEADQGAAIVGPKLLNPDYTIRQAGSVLYSDATTDDLGRNRPRHDAMFCFEREVSGAFPGPILVQSSFWKLVGGLDERYASSQSGHLDLAMQARARGRSVVYAPGSEVLKLQDDTVARAEPPATDRDALREKWKKRLAEAHLPADIAPQVAAAHAEKTVPHAAQQRRKSGRLNVLYFTPFPSHPANHGNQATIQSFGRRFQQMGHKIHFALLQSPIFDSDSEAAMRKEWDSFELLPNSKQLWSNGDDIEFDAWYDPVLGEKIRLLCTKYDIDVLFCSYVFQSKLLEFVPAHVLKVIDTHDKMGGRYDMLRKNGQPLEFFSCSHEEEGEYLRRADVVVARRAEEATYFDSVTGRNSAIVIPHVEEPRYLQRTPVTALRNVGFVASANRINLAIALDLLQSIERVAGENPVPFTLHIAGQVRDMISSLTPDEQSYFSRPWVRLHGFVPDIADFYNAVDVVVSPVTMGTGINVKTVQAMAYGMPLVATAWGTKGIETDHPMHNYASLQDLATGLFRLRDNPKETVEQLATLSRTRYQAFYDESANAMQALFAKARC